MKAFKVQPPKLRVYQGGALDDQDALEDIARRQHMRAIPGEWLKQLEADREKERLAVRRERLARAILVGVCSAVLLVLALIGAANQGARL